MFSLFVYGKFNLLTKLKTYQQRQPENKFVAKIKL